MLINEISNLEEVQRFEADFRKRFTNFGKKAPIPLSFDIKGFNIYVHEYNQHEVKAFYFKDRYNAKAMIKEIKDWLCEHKYPVMIQIKVTESDYSSIEIADMIKRKEITINEVMSTKKIQQIPVRWRIEKVFSIQNTFIVRNIDQNQLFKFKFDTPVLIFLKRIREKKFDSFQAWEFFERNSTNMGICVEVDEDNQPLPKDRKFYLKKKIEL